MTDPTKPLTADEIAGLKDKAQIIPGDAWDVRSSKWVVLQKSRVQQLIATIEQQAEQIEKLRGALTNLRDDALLNGFLREDDTISDANEALVATEPVNDKR